MPRRERQRQPKTPQEIASVRRHHVFWLAGLVLLVFASTLGGDFVWTDRDDILQGGHRLTQVDDLSAALSQTRDAYRTRLDGTGADGAAGTWQPLTLLSNSISWALWGDCAFCFHLENLLLHLAMVIGLYALGRHLLSQRRHGTRLAFWTAALYAAHPATVATVAWIGARPYLLAGVLGVWSLVVFTRLQATTNSHRRHVNRWLLGLAGMSLAAMLAHETAYLLPLLALLIAGYESKERGRRSLGGIAPVRLKALVLLLLCLALVVGYRSTLVGGLHFSADYPGTGWFDNLGTALRHFWYLVDQTLLPAEPVISDAWPITQGWKAGEAAALLGLLLVVAVTLIGLKTGQPAAFGVAWFMIGVIPGVGIFPSDHYHSAHTLYLAAWGLTFTFVQGIWLLWRPVGRQLVPGAEIVVFGPLILFLGVISAFSGVRWWDHDRLFQGEIASDPHYIEGRLELARSALQNADSATAVNHVMAAFEAAQDKGYTGYWSPRDGHFLLGRAQWELKQFGEAIGSFSSALEHAPDDIDTRHWLGIAQLSMGQFETAEATLRKVLERRPGFIEGQADLGAALAGQERFVEAYPLLKTAFDRGLSRDRWHRAFALVLIDAGQFAQAIPHLEAALARREDATDRARLAWVAWRLGDSERAHSDLNIALQLEEETSPYVDWVRRQLQQGLPEAGQ